jgi:hypothetical protein
VIRGTLFALGALVLGVIAWAIVSAIGFISGWVALGIALVALWLYRKGSGGRISYTGAAWVSVLTFVTLIIAFFVGIAVGNPIRFNQALSRGTLPALLAADPLTLLFPLVFGVLGVVIVFRTAAQQKKQLPAESASAPPA